MLCRPAQRLTILCQVIDRRVAAHEGFVIGEVAAHEAPEVAKVAAHEGLTDEDAAHAEFQLTGIAAHEGLFTGEFWKVLENFGRLESFWMERFDINGKIWQTGRAPKMVFIGRKFFSKRC